MRYKKATKLAAPEYVDALMAWAQGLLDNEELFPSEMGTCSTFKLSGTAAQAAAVVCTSVSYSTGGADVLHIYVRTGKPFSKSFRDTIGRLFRRLFRVYAHLYSNHFDHICALGIEGQSAAGRGPHAGRGDRRWRARRAGVHAGIYSAPEHELPALLPVCQRGERTRRGAGPGRG